MPAVAEVRTAKLLSIYEIGARTGHSHVAVHKAIERLGIFPDQILGNNRYFSENVILILSEKMRKPRNGRHHS